MNQIALPDIQDRITEILDEVRERNQEYVVTDDGRPIAHLTPASETPAVREEDAWDHYTETVEEVHQAQSKAWRTQDVLDDIRRF